jgi:hypothetical protein
MTVLDERTKSRWRAFLSSREGHAMMSFLREKKPSTKLNIDNSMEPHHMQFCYGHNAGADARLDQIESLVKEGPPPPAPPPRMKDTRHIGET